MTPEAFIKKFGSLAISVTKNSGINPELCITQAAAESGFGSSPLCLNSYNYFGIMADSSWTGKKDGSFRKYSSATESFNDYVKFLHENSRYKPLFKAGNESFEKQYIIVSDVGYNGTIPKDIAAYKVLLRNTYSVLKTAFEKMETKGNTQNAGLGLFVSLLLAGAALKKYSK